MTTRVYLAAVRLVDETTLPDDLPAERVFVNASDVPEFWVETESPSVPEVAPRLSSTLESSMVRRAIQVRNMELRPNYSLGSVTLLLVPIVAWFARRRPSGSPAPSERSSPLTQGSPEAH